MSTTRRQLLSLGGFVAAAWMTRSRRAFASALPSDLLARADEMRNPSDSYLLRVTLDHGEGERWELEVFSRSNRQCLVKTLGPPRERGRALLMIDENMWAYLPNLKRSVRVALAQKLVGQAANGDLTRARWSGDYTPRLEGETDTEWRVLLTANKKGLTYEKMRAWIEKGTFRPLRAECLSLSGSPLKRIAYTGYRELCGKERASQIHITDVLRPSDKSVIAVTAMELRKFPESMFTPESLH